MTAKLRLPGPDQWLQYLTLAMSAFLIVYLVTYAQNERARNDCREAFDIAVHGALIAGREAVQIRERAMDDLVAGLLLPGNDSNELLRTYQSQRHRSVTLRADNPIPDPHCDHDEG